MKPGSLVYILWPHSDTGASKPRPAFVLTAPDHQGDVTLLKVTGNPTYAGSVPLENEDLIRGNLKKTSFVRTDRFLSVHTSLLEERGVEVGEAKLKEVTKRLILQHTRSFSHLAHAANRPGDDPLHPHNQPPSGASPLQAGGPQPPTTDHRPPKTVPVPYAGRVFDEDEVEAAVSATLDFWLTLGSEGAAMEKELAAFLGVKHSLLVNSGSSANLVAISALTTHKLPKHKRIQPGDEVITVAAGFPTTVAPIIQVGAVPVFIDADPVTGNADCSQLEAAYTPGKTKAVMMAHALGNPFDLATTLAFCKKYDLWLIEDNCDALGCTYSLALDLAKELGLDHLIKIAEKGEHPVIRITHHPSPINNQESSALLTAYTGTFGDFSTQSFYPPHHLTMGEGGAVNIIRRAPLKTYAESFRDWGRDCWCASGVDNTCGKRFGWQLGELPEGYDHKYIYSHLGFNLKPLDPQAAIGRVQLRRLPAFIQARKDNWEYLRRGLADLEAYFEFALPTHATRWIPPSERKDPTPADLTSVFEWSDGSIGTFDSPPTTNNPQPLRGVGPSGPGATTPLRSDCSWFGFKITVREGAPFARTDFAPFLDKHKIGNRMLFGGNLVRQPAFVQLRKDRPEAIRVVSNELGVVSNELGETHHPSPITHHPSPITHHPPPITHHPPPITHSPLPGADRIMNDTIFLGTYPGLTRLQLDYMIEKIHEFVASFQKPATSP
jgi:CDP-6-deoxy-D-xylo-4-hexulose-3-dehydrase